jgi:hypothetical protein
MPTNLVSTSVIMPPTWGGWVWALWGLGGGGCGGWVGVITDHWHWQSLACHDDDEMMTDSQKALKLELWACQCTGSRVISDYNVNSLLAVPVPPSSGSWRQHL